MFLYLLFFWYLDLFRHAGYVFKGVELQEFLYTKERFHKFLIVSACHNIDDDVCDALAASLGIPAELAREDLLEDYFGIHESAEYARDWYTFYQFDHEMYALGLVS
jgi:hypothetical protein